MLYNVLRKRTQWLGIWDKILFYHSLQGVRSLCGVKAVPQQARHCSRSDAVQLPEQKSSFSCSVFYCEQVVPTAPYIKVWIILSVWPAASRRLQSIKASLWPLYLWISQPKKFNKPREKADVCI